MIIKEISTEIHKNATEKGFWENKETKNVGELLMLCVSELSEALEATKLRTSLQIGYVNGVKSILSKLKRP